MPYIKINPSFAISAGGVTYSTDVNDGNNEYDVTGTATITSDNIFQHTGSLVTGLTYVYRYKAVATYNGGTVIFHGVAMTAEQALKNYIVIASYAGAAWNVDFVPDLAEDSVIGNAKLIDGTITLAKLVNLTSAQVIVGNGSNIPTATAVTGDIGITNGGVASISAGVIVNADVNASAAIAYSKLAALTSGQIIVGSAGNVPTAVAMSGDVAIVASGATTIQAGAVDPAMLSGNGAKEVWILPVSFQSGEQCNNPIIAPYAGTIDQMESFVTLALAGTDAGTITANIEATPVTDGAITVALSSPLNTQDSATPSAANAFAAGDIISFISAKTTVGGKCLLSVQVTRT